MHSTGASMFFVVVYLHMFRGLMYGSYRKPRELTWIFGCLIYLCLMAEAFFGYLLPWGQMSYWGAQVIVNLFATVPFIGEDLAQWIRGDYTISDITLNRFFAFHVIALPLVLLGLVAAHLMALHETAPTIPTASRSRSSRRTRRPGLPLDGIYSHPYYTVKDIVGVIVFLAVFSVIMFFVPDMGGYFLEANNFIPANPLQTPEHIAPVWYFTPYYAILRAVPSFLRLAVLGRAGDGRRGDDLLLAAVARPRHGEVDPLSRHAVQVVAGGVRDRVPDPGLPRRRAGHRVGPVRRKLPILGGADKATVVARVLTVVYFLFFLLMPWYTARDKTKPVPERVTWHEASSSFSLAGVVAGVRSRRCASGGADLRLVPAPVNRLDAESLQRGARNFVNYCLNCHSAKYMRYKRLTDLGIDRR